MSKEHIGPERTVLTATLIRKIFHTKAKRDDVDKNNLTRVTSHDPHSNAVAENNYVLDKRRIQAAGAEATFRDLCGDPVEWPTEEEIRKSRVTLATLTKGIVAPDENGPSDVEADALGLPPDSPRGDVAKDKRTTATPSLHQGGQRAAKRAAIYDKTSEKHAAASETIAPKDSACNNAKTTKKHSEANPFDEVPARWQVFLVLVMLSSFYILHNPHQ